MEGAMMVKGIQREMVMVRTAQSELFEMAYFILRSDTEKKYGSKSIIYEANSIVSAMCADGAREVEREKRKKQRRAGLLWFFAGALAGGLAVLIIGAF